MSIVILLVSRKQLTCLIVYMSSDSDWEELYLRNHTWTWCRRWYARLGVDAIVRINVCVVLRIEPRALCIMPSTSNMFPALRGIYFVCKKIFNYLWPRWPKSLKPFSHRRGKIVALSLESRWVQGILWSVEHRRTTLGLKRWTALTFFFLELLWGKSTVM
jgi:hypothetical protein